MGEPNAIIKHQETCVTDNEQQLKATNYNHPCVDLLKGRGRKHYSSICVPLYNAILNGDWETATIIFEGEAIHVGDSVVNLKDLVRYCITEDENTPLHLAALTGNTKFVRQLLGMMKDDDLKLQNKEGNTAFCIAAMAGNVEMTKIMVERNIEILTIRGSGNMMPLYLAASYGNHEMVRYLYENFRRMTTDKWPNDDRNKVLLACITNYIFDVALHILNDNEEIGFLQDKHLGDALHQLALMPAAFLEWKHSFISRLVLRWGLQYHQMINDASCLLRKFSKKNAEKPNDEIDVKLKGPVNKIDGKDTYPSPTLFVAAKTGNSTFLVELIRQCPDLLWKRNDDGHTIFHIAVLYRHHGIYSLLYEIGSMKDTITQLIDKEGNNMLHLAANIPKRKRLLEVSGAALQMHHELLWYKELEGMVLPRIRDMKNKEGLTPYELLTQNHQALASEGEAWIKGTVNQSMVAAALIATIGFSVVFSIPGGFDQNNGLPIFLHNKNFIAFVILDAISFILSSISILAFLSLMGSRYAERDFLESLPRKLMFGQATLFLSIFTVMAAFSASFFVIYHNRLTIIISILAFLPILFFILQQYGLFKDTIRSVYRSTYLFKPKKHMLYYHNPTF